MDTLKVPGAQINYTISGGTGPWVTLVNGHTRPITDFRSMAKHLNSMGFRVVCGDNRGAGLTKWQGGFELKDMVDDILALHRHVGITKSHFVGLSMGGVICQRLALDHPSQIEKLVLVSTAPAAAYIRSEETSWPDSLEGIEDRLLGYFSPEFFEANKVLVKAMAKQMHKGFQDSGSDAAQGAQQQRIALAGFDFQKELPGLTVPTRVIHGDIDQIVPLTAGERLAGLIPHSDLVVLKGAGHLLLAERGKDLYEAIAGYLK